eukprot:NODE_602_length_2060_cov_51.536052_g556_i0.p1 GENE.NODE_602_length_2060_cov_51.536052_g556_i0~~NODE_602_length_2060_cov_51.536052_g556_i0.p1  ORF type:complete len:612 (-),score=135.18 NODE_602_length_2060_cov_51.536052_g556_i0:149-1984(-)
MSDEIREAPTSDAQILQILENVRTIAVVGASSNRNRPGYFVPKYLQLKGYRVVPVNPAIRGTIMHDELVYENVAAMPFPVDMVEIFRNSQAAGEIVDEVLALPTKPAVIWMQLGVYNLPAAEKARAAGIAVVMNRCPKIEFGRFSGELGWYGVNSRVTSSKARVPPIPKPVTKKKISAKEEKARDYGFSTRAIHAGASPDPTTGSRVTPIHQTSSFVFDDADHASSLFNLHNFGFIYSRLGNPTTSVLEERIASLEGGRSGLCCASGHAAQFLTFFTLLDPGDEFVASQNLYGGSLTQFKLAFAKLGWTCHLVDPHDPENFRRALTPKCKAIFIEVLSNPGGLILDCEAIAEVAHDAGIPLIVDNTMASPFLFKPIEHGADIVVHSTTKFLCGHGNSLGGAIVESGKFNWLASSKQFNLTLPEPAYHGLNFYETFGDFAFTTKARAVGLRDFGPTMSPMNAWLTITGIETLPLRMEKHTYNGLKVAEFLENHPQVAWVSYAGLPSSPYHELFKKYFPRGVGGVYTFGLKGGYEAGLRVVENVLIWSHLANLGDTRSLILHPASTTHRQLSDEQRIAAGAGPDVIRLSVGIEDVEDLIADLDRALTKAAEES